jgi:hypothetical protein
MVQPVHLSDQGHRPSHFRRAMDFQEAAAGTRVEELAVELAAGPQELEF